MALTPRQRGKLATKAEKKLDGTQVLGLATASAGPEPRTLLWSFIGGYVVLSVVLSLLFRTFIAPGALIAIIVYFLVNKPRYLVRTPQGVAVLKKGLLNNQPEGVVAQVGEEVLDRPVSTASGRHRFDVGAEHVWLKESELEALRAGLG